MFPMNATSLNERLVPVLGGYRREGNTMPSGMRPGGEDHTACSTWHRAQIQRGLAEYDEDQGVRWAGLKQFMLWLWEPARGKGTVLAISLLVLALGWGLSSAGTLLSPALDSRSPTAGPVYSVGVLQREIARDPWVWVGRRVLVKAQVASYSAWVGHAPTIRIVLIDPGTSSAAGLSVAWGGADPLLGFLRGVPLAGALTPRPQALHWGRFSTYRIRLESVPGNIYASPACCEALLLDSQGE